MLVLGSQGCVSDEKYIEKMSEINIEFNTNKEELVWFAMSAPYCKELDAKRLLEKQNVESFVPMCYEIVLKKGGAKSRELVPAIHNLIFVRTTRSIMQDLKKQILFLQYLIRPENGKNIPVIVPDTQMKQFITVSETHCEKLTYLKPDEVDLRRGTPVRIIGGTFDGVEGFFVKVRGIRSKRVVVSVQGIAAMAIAEIRNDLIEVLSQKL